MTEVVAIIASAVTGAAVWYLKTTVTFKRTEREALKLLMKDLFLQKMDKIEDANDYAYLESIYTTYTALGGNGYIKNLYYKIMEGKQ